MIFSDIQHTVKMIKIPSPYGISTAKALPSSLLTNAYARVSNHPDLRENNDILPDLRLASAWEFRFLNVLSNASLVFRFETPPHAETCRK